MPLRESLMIKKWSHMGLLPEKKRQKTYDGSQKDESVFSLESFGQKEKKKKSGKNKKRAATSEPV